MERKLLLSIAMLLLFAFNTSAETVENLPALPINSSVEVVEQNDVEQVSFWKKFLNFFSFSKEKKEDLGQKEPFKEEDTNVTPSEDTTIDIPEFDSNKLQIKRLEENDEPVADDAMGLDNIKTHSEGAYNNSQENETPVIPNGFEDDGPLKLPDGISELIESVEKESEKNNKDDNSFQPVETPEEKLPKQDVEDAFIDKDPKPKFGSDQKTEDVNDLKLPEGFGDITIDDSEQPDARNRKNFDQELEEIEEDKNLPLEPMNKLDSVPPADTLQSDNSSDDRSAKNLVSPADEVQSADKPVAKLPENNVAIENNPIPDKTLPIPDYASAPDNSQKTESRIEKFTKNFTNKKSGNIELPKITEQDYETNEKGEIKRDIAEIDSTQLQFINNETQVLILPNDDVVLGKLTEHAKINEMDLYSYIKLFWENYDRLKREPQREIIESFIEEYDENFNKEKYH